MSASAITMWMWYSLCIGAVATVAAVAAAEAQRAANRPVRWVWAGAIVAIVALTLAAPMRRADNSASVALITSAVVAGTSHDAPVVSGVGVWYAAARVALEMPLREALGAVQQAIAGAPAIVSRLLVLLWMFGSLLALAAFVVSYVRIRRRVLRWPLQQVGDVPVRISPSAGPAVVGLAPPQIILPSWLLGRSREEQALVVAHEQEHVRAGDPWLLIGACSALVLFPWNPALWFAFSRLQLAVELDCDRRVLKRGVPAATYGALLIEISSLRNTLPSAMPAFSHNSSYLERRLLAMTSRVSKYATTRRIAGVAIAAVAFIAACESRLPTSAEIEKTDAATATKQATELGLVQADKVKYTVDGKPVSALEAKNIAAERIATVNVLKGKMVGDSSEVRVVTRAEDGVPVVVRMKRPFTTTADSADVLRMRREAELSGRGPNGEPMLMRKKFDGLLLVDGKVVEASVLESIRPETIESVEVVKGSAAAKYTDPRAANGVIQVTLKKP